MSWFKKTNNEKKWFFNYKEFKEIKFEDFNSHFIKEKNMFNASVGFWLEKKYDEYYFNIEFGSFKNEFIKDSNNNCWFSIYLGIFIKDEEVQKLIKYNKRSIGETRAFFNILKTK